MGKKIFIETCFLSGSVYHYSFKSLKVWLTMKRQLKLNMQRIKGLFVFAFWFLKYTIFKVSFSTTENHRIL